MFIYNIKNIGRGVKMQRENQNYTFGDMAIQTKGQNKFLKRVNQLLDWEKIEEQIKKYYKKEKSGNGTPGYSGIFLFKIILLQQWYDLSDPKVEAELK